MRQERGQRESGIERPAWWRGRMGVVVLGAAVFVALAAGPGRATIAGRLLGEDSSPSANDAFVDASPVGGNTIVGTTDGASADPSEIAAGVSGADDHTVWYTWTPGKHGWAYLSPTLAGGSMPTVKVFTGVTIDGLTEVDEATAGGINIPATAGDAYRIAVSSPHPGGPFDLTLFQPDQGAPPNDHVEGAIDLASALTASGGATAEVAVDTLGGASADPGEVGAVGPAAHSVWFVWTPTNDGNLTLEAQPRFGGPGAIGIGVWTGTDVASLTPVDSGTGTVSAPVTAGTRYLISIDGPEQWYVLDVSATNVPGADHDAPVVSCGAVAPDWVNASITVPCTATDGGSGLAQPADAAFDLTYAPPAGVETTDARTDARAVCDAAGNCTTAGPLGPIHADTEPPAVTCDAAPVAWVAGEVIVVCTATDHGSGLADPEDASRGTPTGVPDGEAHEVTIPSRAVCDLVGNCATAPAVGPVMVDRAAPVVSCEPAPPPDTALTADFEIACHATDDGSGLADASAQSFTLGTDVPAGTAVAVSQTATRDVCDLVGNCTTAGPVSGPAIDRAAPLVDCARPSEWMSAAITVHCVITDSGTGLAPGTPATIDLTADVPAGTESAQVTTNAQPVCDIAGNCSSAGPITNLRIDRRAPAIACDPAPTAWSLGPVVVRCGATDGGSGLDNPTTDVITFEVGGVAGEEGRFDSGSTSVCDTVGNCATAGPVIGVPVDRKPPVVTCDPPPTGVVRDEAVIHCTAADGGSGLLSTVDSSFDLVTDVGEGNANAAAQTDTHEVCDATGSCTTAGPFTVSVDRTVDVLGPALPVPARVTVIAAVDPAAGVVAPFTLPDGTGRTVTCQPAPGSLLPLGWTVVICDAVDGAGVHGQGVFPLVEKPVPSLAAHGVAVSGGAWRAVGIGFAPGSAVTVELDGSVLVGGTAAADGRISLDITIPASVTTGPHTLVVRGRDAAANEMLVVSPIDVAQPDPNVAPPTTPPPGAPVLPPSGPAVPADPGPPPPMPQLHDVVVPPPPTTTPTTLEPLPTVAPTVTTTAPGTPPTTTVTDGGTSPLPLTGAAVGGLVLVGLVLILTGRRVLARSRAMR